MAGPKRKGQVQQPPKSRFSRKIKVFSLIILIVAIPSIVIITTIIACQRHFIKTLKISEAVFLSAPEHIDLVDTHKEDKRKAVGDCYSFKINGYTFYIPENFTPSKIDYDTAEFREKSRSEGRLIYLHADIRNKRLTFDSTGISRWFLPREMRYFLPLVLNSTVHPIRLMFKAQLFASEGITSKIFTADWDKNHVGYIFPTPGNEGYFARIFRMDNKNGGSVEFMMSDSVSPVTLRAWVDLALKIQMSNLTEDEIASDKNDDSLFSLDDIIEQANDVKQQRKTLTIALSEFFRNKESEWLIPVAIVMQDRGFFPDVLDLIEDYNSTFNKESKHFEKWNEIVDKAVAESITIEIDPQLDLRELNVYCKNLTDLDIRQVTLNITVTSNLGVSQSFSSSLLSQSSLRSREEKQIKIKCPSDISIANAVSISHRVTSLEYAK